MPTSVNNVARLFNRQPYETSPPGSRSSDLDILSRYAEVAEDEAHSAATLMTPALGVTRQTREQLHAMVSRDVREEIDTVSAFHHASVTARVLMEALQAAGSKLALAIHEATRQPSPEA